MNKIYLFLIGIIVNDINTLLALNWYKLDFIKLNLYNITEGFSTTRKVHIFEKSILLWCQN